MKKAPTLKRILALCTALLIWTSMVALNPSITYGANVNIPEPIYKKTEFRAVWIPSVANIVWPSKKNLTAEKQQEEFSKLMDQAFDMGMNAVIVQVRPSADAFYKSTINPWSEYLTGQQGKDPGYDPLAFMIEEAHKRNLEFHAWVNPFRASNSGEDKNWAANSVVKTHPDWIINYDNKKYINPGLPEARQYVVDSITEIVLNYDVDAIHIDDYFYPYMSGNTKFPDDNAFNKYKAEFKDVKDWRRDNINSFIKSVRETLRAADPYVKLGVSPFGIWRNTKADPTGADVSSTTSSYDSVFADTRLWINNGWIDYITPQIYWEFGNKYAAYEKVLDFWVKEMDKNPNVHLYIGHAPYKIGTGEKNSAWQNPKELPNQLAYAQSFSQVNGSAFYNMNSLLNNPLGVKKEISSLYKYPALIPAMTWIDNEAPKAPTISSTPTKGIVNLTITGDDDTTSVAIYRFAPGEKVDTSKASALFTTLRCQNGSATLTVNNSKGYTYVVTALDRLYNESPASKPVYLQ